MHVRQPRPSSHLPGREVAHTVSIGAYSRSQVPAQRTARVIRVASGGTGADGGAGGVAGAVDNDDGAGNVEARQARLLAAVAGAILGDKVPSGANSSSRSMAMGDKTIKSTSQDENDCVASNQYINASSNKLSITKKDTAIHLSDCLTKHSVVATT